MLLYRAITGELPFYAESDSLLALRIVNDQAVPVLKRRPDTPPALVRAVELAMDKAPEARPTMRELRELLLDSDAAPRAVRDEITITTPILRTEPPNITVDPARVRTPPALPAVRTKRRD